MQTTTEPNIKQTLIKGNGKLLLSGEYFVLDGAKALALPSRFGQSFAIDEIPNESQNNFLHWTARNVNNEIWLETTINIKDFRILGADSKEAQMLTKILLTCKELNPDFLNTNANVDVNAYLEFPNDWGLGSSSTLIYFMSKWASINPYRLLEKTFGGSGYDIACAENHSAIYYTRNDAQPLIEKINFYPTYRDQIYFVHLNQKMNSRNAILYYKNLDINKEPIISEISKLSTCFVNAVNIEEFEKCMLQHELLLSKTLKIERVKNTLFKNYWGEVKSLGAWGGDFVMVTNTREEQEFKKYMIDKGFETILSYDEMILNTYN